MNRSILIKEILADARGATAVEYGLIVSLIVIAIVGAMQGVGNGNGGLWGKISQTATTAMGGS
ncbi:Flp family type IVb pilin [Altererythrobacter fulvus]|uniref:Flp family type IVb pilin n=1 Tax=Caenibius fulvus TaxID=2126012 RepID=UPI003019A2F7